ncbi:uncharacterized protein LOC113147535 [Cyclospora cayetanensis]|uniref:Uncharacterized protein LOC113147535 n=1 Tax=Cyclospora cayetanensis TaxID=88456 RepID=A0A6P6S4G1_9EIME|nr:uncharacterized protein LOC113147535 [Cyclospora cayetanensis]
MSNFRSLSGPWPDLTPPREAVHLRQSYDSLRSQLLPSDEPLNLFASSPLSFSEGFQHNKGLVGSTCAVASLCVKSSRGVSSKEFHTPQNTFTSGHRTNTKGCHQNVRSWHDKTLCTPGCPTAVLRTHSLPVGSPSFPREPERERNLATNATTDERITSKFNTDGALGAAAISEGRLADLPPSTPRNHAGHGAQRSQSSECLRATPHKSHLNAFLDTRACSRNHQLEYCIPMEVEALLLRLKHRSYNNGATTFSWRRLHGRPAGADCTAHNRRSYTRGIWKWEGGMMVSLDDQKLSTLRQEALNRVRERARGARQKQQQQLLHNQLQQQQQQQRSRVLAQQLRKRTLQRIREKSLKQEEKRQEELLMQKQMMLEAEVQRQYCTQHRRALQNRLVQQQREIERKIRMHAEESLRHSMEAKARTRQRGYKGGGRYDHAPIVFLRYPYDFYCLQGAST